jgi:hypothetical protein
MNDARRSTDVAHDASNAARLLARARWGKVRVRRLAHELADRADELGARERAELRLALALTDDNDEPPEDAA